MLDYTKQGSVHVFASDAPLNHEHTPVAAEQLAPHLLAGQPRIVLNLEHVPLIDSAGLEFLLTTQQTCTRRGGTLRLATPSPLCRQILEVTGVGDRIEIFPDLTTAVGSYAQ
jgi:anti-anti-sigma factor